jgi:two-component system OmpR family response regulator
MLPGVSGLDVLRSIRREMTMPVLMLSARETEIDKVVGLELGADDYITKPFGLRELLARVRAMLRRTEMLRNEPGTQGVAQGEANTGVLALGSLSIDSANRSVTNGGQPVEMKPKEFDLLTFLATHPRQVFSREMLLDRVWGYDFVGGTRTVDVHISWLRRKLEADPSKPTIIETVHGVGYRLRDPLQVNDVDKRRKQ